KVRRRFLGHRAPAPTASFTADGKKLVTAGWDATALVWDVTGSASPGQSDMESLWRDLADEDAEKAFRAVRLLSRSPQTALPWMQQHLQPASALDDKQVKQLIADLDNGDFAVRQRTTIELEKLGERARPALEHVLENQPSLETRQRVEGVLDKLRAD